VSDDSAAAGPVATAPRPRTGPFRSIAHRLATGVVLPDEGRLPPLDRATAWLNGPPLTPADLRGRVLLVDFWTYTCVNWLRTLPYLRAWHQKYAAAGLTVVGVHTPEFGFEHDLRNVTAQTSALGIEYPVAVDSDYGVWDDFANSYWPAVYLADGAGRIRHHHFGEGEYAQTEMVIQQLLMDAGAEIDLDLVMVEPRGLEVAAEWATLRSPESYLGYGQSSGFVAEDVHLFDVPHVYDPVRGLPLNAWNLAGDWTHARHAAVLNAAGGSVSFAFHARDVNLVMGPATAGATIPFRVTLGGQAPGTAHGTDVDADGLGIVDRQATYQLIRQTGRISDRVVGIEFLDAGVEAYCFTFG
jgi:thiol-disulfide isomerase/thioredoxin